jgi:hypothetical protein
MILIHIIKNAFWNDLGKTKMVGLLCFDLIHLTILLVHIVAKERCSIKLLAQDLRQILRHEVLLLWACKKDIIGGRLLDRSHLLQNINFHLIVPLFEMMIRGRKSALWVKNLWLLVDQPCLHLVKGRLKMQILEVLLLIAVFHLAEVFLLYHLIELVGWLEIEKFAELVFILSILWRITFETKRILRLDQIWSKASGCLRIYALVLSSKSLLRWLSVILIYDHLIILLPRSVSRQFFDL